MSSLIRVAAAAVAVIATTCPVLADIGCPSNFEGHRLAPMDGASLYIGDPSRNMLVAPDRENIGGKGVNGWGIANSATMTLVCAYEGGGKRLVQQLPAGLTKCVQDIKARTFTCS